MSRVRPGGRKIKSSREERHGEEAEVKGQKRREMFVHPQRYGASGIRERLRPWCKRLLPDVAKDLVPLLGSPLCPFNEEEGSAQGHRAHSRSAAWPSSCSGLGMKTQAQFGFLKICFPKSHIQRQDLNLQE